MTQRVLKTRTLVTDDGVPIEATHLPNDGDLAIVLAHGFTLSWQHGAVSVSYTHLTLPTTERV